MSLRTLAARFGNRRTGQDAPPAPDSPPAGATHVIQYYSPLLLNPSDRYGGPGWWEIQTLADHDAGTPADCQPSMDGGPGTPVAMLAFFAGGVFGCPVTLTPFSEEVMAAGDPDGEWLPAPGYYITPGE